MGCHQHHHIVVRSDMTGTKINTNAGAHFSTKDCTLRYSVLQNICLTQSARTCSMRFQRDGPDEYHSSGIVRHNSSSQHRQEKDVQFVLGHRQPPPARCYLLAQNEKRSNNVGPILRCAAAFAVEQIIFVGYSQCAVAGAHGADRHVNITSFPTLRQAVQYLKQDEAEDGCGVKSIVGILNGRYNCEPTLHSHRCEEQSQTQNSPIRSGKEYAACNFAMNDVYDSNGTPVIIDNKGVVTLDYCRHSTPCTHELDEILSCEDTVSPEKRFLNGQKKSYPIHARRFHKNENVCFISGRSVSEGISLDQHQICDYFVHIPHLCLAQEWQCREIRSSTNALDVQTCLSIVLHHFTSFAQYRARGISKYKFEMAIVTNVGSAKMEDLSNHHDAHIRKAERLAKKKDRDLEDNVHSGMLDLLFQPRR